MARLLFIDDRNIQFFEPFLRREDGPAQSARGRSGLLRIGAAVDGSAVGAIGAELRGKGACLVSIAVAPTFRRQGLAAFMLQGLLRLLKNTGTVRVCAPTPSWTDNAEVLRGLLRKAGFEREGADRVYVYALAEIAKRPQVLEMAGRADNRRVCALSAASAYHLRLLNERIVNNGGAEGLASGDDIDRETCALYCETNDVPAALLFARNAEGIDVRWLHGNTPAALGAVVANGMKRALQRYKGDIPVQIAAVHPSLDGIVAKLLGEPDEEHGIDTYRIDL
ncbi:MAG: GNAT family N-acetyltransferase [Clostridiales Family XIII bacterium]|jgi:GNAT superfamily N-acetyltransferase|nr:GNAT family N-acetyltransferase [Clostridiales Family XIII bacterium]